MRALHNAVIECRHELDKQHYDSKKSIAYAHPNAVNEALAKSPAYVTPDEPIKCGGVTLEESANVPESLVVVCHIDAARHGPGAIQFAELSDE